MSGHNHSHKHSHSENRKYLTFAFVITVSFMFIEIIGGYVSGSLALLSDAGHMFSDAFALALSIFASKISTKAKNGAKTFGYQRTEIIAALINGMTLILIAGLICFEAFERFVVPSEVKSLEMLSVATLGLFVNLLSAWILTKGSNENLNVKGAYLHILGDALGSVGAIFGGILIYFTNWLYVDPIVSVLIAILIIFSSANLLKETFNILLEGTPQHINFEKVRNSILCVGNILSVHDLHIWSLTNGEEILTCHLVSNGEIENEFLLQKINSMLKSSYHVTHTTIQIETSNSKMFCAKCN
ncbi:cation transporter [bacterium]|nr:cation transporter [bacterium]